MFYYVVIIRNNSCAQPRTPLPSPGPRLPGAKLDAAVAGCGRKTKALRMDMLSLKCFTRTNPKTPKAVNHIRRPGNDCCDGNFIRSHSTEAGVLAQWFPTSLEVLQIPYGPLGQPKVTSVIHHWECTRSCTSSNFTGNVARVLPNIFPWV